MIPTKETDLFDPVRYWFEDGGYTVHSEVSVMYRAGRPDIVAVHGSVVAIAELKTTMSLELMEQAIRWKLDAHHVYVCVPKKKSGFRDFAERILRDYGVGIIEVQFSEIDGKRSGFATCSLRPRLNRKISEYVLRSVGDYNLADNHIKGGSRGGGYSTPYSRTMDKLKNVIGPNWMTIAQIVDRVKYDTHWSAPKTSPADAPAPCDNCGSMSESSAFVAASASSRISSEEEFQSNGVHAELQRLRGENVRLREVLKDIKSGTTGWVQQVAQQALQQTEAKPRHQRPVSDVAGAWSDLDEATKEAIRQELREIRE